MARSRKVLNTLLAGMGIVFLLHLHFITEAGRTADPNDQHNLVVIPMIGAAFCVLNAIFLFGWKRAARLAALSMLLGFLSEVLGVHTGKIFGQYHYTDVLGPKVLGVPLVIALFWFMLVFLAYVITNLITVHRPDDMGTRGNLHDLWLALLGALVATAYDLGLDPYMASPAVAAWVWDPPPPQNLSYFGIPVQNYYGWIGVAFVIMYLARRIDRYFIQDRHETEGLPHYPATVAKLIAAIPVVFYLSFWLQHLSHNYTPPVVVISLVALGVPAVAAVSNWRDWKVGRRAPPAS